MVTNFITFANTSQTNGNLQTLDSVATIPLRWEGSRRINLVEEVIAMCKIQSKDFKFSQIA